MTFVFKTCSKCGARVFQDNLRQSGDCLICGSKPGMDNTAAVVAADPATPDVHIQARSEVNLLLQSARRAATPSEAVSFVTQLLKLDPGHWEAQLIYGFEKAEEKLVYKSENGLRFEWTDEWFLANSLMGTADPVLDRLKARGSAEELIHAKDLIVTRITRHLKARSRLARRQKITTDDEVFKYWKKIETYLSLIDYCVCLLDEETICEKDNLLSEKIDLLQMKLIYLSELCRTYEGVEVRNRSEYHQMNLAASDADYASWRSTGNVWLNDRQKRAEYAKAFDDASALIRRMIPGFNPPEFPR